MKMSIPKKTLTGIMSVVVLFSFFTQALAADDTGDHTETYEQSGEGTVVFFALEEIFSIIVPTNASLDFLLDPLGLSSLTDGGAGKTIEELRNGPAAGFVDFHKNTPVVINHSNFDVLVDFDVFITGDTVIAESAAAATVGYNDDTMLFIGLTVSKDSVNNPAVNADDFKGTLQLALTGSLQRVRFVLDQASYDTDNKMIDGSGWGTQLLFSGACNPYGDWRNFIDNNREVGLEAVFTFGKPTGDEVLYNKDLAYGLVDTGLIWSEDPDGGGGDKPDPDVGFIGTENPREITLTVYKPETVTIPFNFGDTVDFGGYVMPGITNVTPWGLSKTDSAIVFNSGLWPPPGTYEIHIILNNHDRRDAYIMYLTII